jgi:hypothetical protein
MRFLPLFLAVAAFPLAAIAAEPGSFAASTDAAQWVWCKPDAGTSAPERAEVRISGTSLSGRLFLGDKEYARLTGVIRPASKNSDISGATTGVWEITATETTGDGAAAHKLLLKGAYTKYQSAQRGANGRDGSYAMLSLSTSGADGAEMVISRLEAAIPLRVAAR